MAKWEVNFDVRKGNSSTSVSKIVEAESEDMAVRIAESQVKSSNSKFREGYDFNIKSIRRK